jgi:phage-related minor tail protein
MDDEIETLVIRVRADTSGVARDVADIRAGLEGPLGAGAERAGRAIETGLLRAVRTGKLGFEDLRRSVLSVMDAIAASALKGGIEGLFGSGGGAGSGGLGGVLSSLLGGAPGRATGGPVSPGRPYWVGERGPELMVPTSAGSVLPAGVAGAREVRVAITVNAAAGEAPAALRRSTRQVARAVRAAIGEA